VCGCFIFESAKNTQLIDSKKNKYSGALVLICRLISSYNTVPPDPSRSRVLGIGRDRERLGGIGMSFSADLSYRESFPPDSKIIASGSNRSEIRERLNLL